MYFTVPANMLHRACKYAAQRLHICCTRPANTLPRACKLHCTGPANTPHRACKLQCTEPAKAPHRACKLLCTRPANYSAQGLQIRRTGLANYIWEPIWKYAAQGLRQNHKFGNPFGVNFGALGLLGATLGYFRISKGRGMHAKTQYLQGLSPNGNPSRPTNQSETTGWGI